MQAAQLLQQRPLSCPSVIQQSTKSISSRTVSCKSLNRRDLIASTSGLLVWTAADRAAATEDEQQQAATAAAQDAAQEQQATAAAASRSDSKAAAAQKKRKKRPAAAKAKQKSAAKAPGTIPRVKLTDQLEVSKVRSSSSSSSSLLCYVIAQSAVCALSDRHMPDICRK
jgi:hypothetical protein